MTARELLVAVPKDPWDPMHSSDAVANHWTTTNLGEAVPGILTPLAASMWGDRVHATARRVAYNVGVLSGREYVEPLPPEERVTRLFYGRLTAKLEYMSLLGDRMPGVTGAEIIESLFNEPPAGMTFHPTRRRYPMIALRMTHTFVRTPQRLMHMCGSVDNWWRAEVQRVPELNETATIDALKHAMDRFQHAMNTHVTAMFGSFQPVFDTLERLVRRAGTGDLAVLSGSGGAEMAVVGDIWRASRGEIDVAVITRAHGFHGPEEGEVSARVWRDDPAPLHRVVEHYRALPDARDPSLAEEEREQRRAVMTREVLAALPRHERPGAALVMRLAAERIPARGRGKRAFLQATDIVRMSARRLGELWVAAGVLKHPEDPFYLTEHELTRPLPPNVRDLVDRRRERRVAYGRIEFEEATWRGMPQVSAIVVDSDPDPVGDEPVEGVGASAGVVEGLVRVVEDPAFEDVEPGEVLVAATTDPSWCSIMFVSAALVVDLGGMLSHAAVVAREIGIPCVVNARDATKRLRTGDTVRVDGKRGTVEILARA